MKDIIGDYLEHVKIGGKQTYKNLTLFPLLSEHSPGLEYLLLDEALGQGHLEVQEVNREGSVPELMVVNRSPGRVLILDGEELVGAKQNRVVNVSILIRGDSKTVIPVSCVEQGRWSYDSDRFSSRERIMTSRLRSMKAEHVSASVRAGRRYMSDQGAIWAEISDQAARREAPSPTMAMDAIYEKDTDSIREYMKHFRVVDSQVGAVFMMGGKVAGLDAFGKPETFEKVFKKLLESYVIDAVALSGEEGDAKASKGEAAQFLRASREARIEAHPSVGEGTDCRMEAEKIAGFALVFDKQVLHLAVFASSNPGDARDLSSRMERFSRRRNRRQS